MVGRYALVGEIASGGMATVYFGRLLGPVGFSRTVAIKRLHPQFSKDPEFVAMLLDEARLATRIQHPNVVGTLDVVALEGELLLVLDYVHGESLARLLRLTRAAGRPVPLRVLGALACGILNGLHAAHEARSEAGEPLGIVHRDVSPQNVLVGVDGMARVLDFGIAKAAGRVQQTSEGQLKGKLAYMSPEQVRGVPLDRRSDVYSASIVLWEAIAGRRLFAGENDGVVFAQVSLGARRRPSEFVPDLPQALDDIIMRGLAREPDDRYPTAWDMAVAIEEALGLASPRQVGQWVAEIAGDLLATRSAQVKEVESLSSYEFAGEIESAADPVHARDGASDTGPRSQLRAPSEPSLPTITPVRSHVTSHPPEPTTGSLIHSFVQPMVRPRSALVFVTAITGVALFVGLGWAMGRKGQTAEPPLASSAAVSARVGTGTAPPPPEGHAPAGPPPTASPSSLPASAPPAPTSAATAGASGRTAPLDRPTATKLPPPPKSAAHCNPPFVLDEAGIRRIKPECL